MIEKEIKLSYNKNENKIYLKINENIEARVSIFSGKELIYSTISIFNMGEFWYRPDKILSEFKNIRIEIKDINDNLIQEKYLNLSEQNYFAELGTDKYIRETHFSDYSFKGIMVEIGAGPPEFYSMSKHFRDNDWRCVCVDPNPKFVQQHKEVGNEIYQYACSFEDKKESDFQIVNTGWEEKNDGISASALIPRYFQLKMFSNKNIENIKVEVKKLDTLLEELNIDHIDFISIDTEGWELEVMRGFNLNKYDPKIVLLENVEHDINYNEYMEKFGYKLNKNINYNYIYIKNN